MGQTSRDIAGALNFRSGLVPMAMDAEPEKQPERIRFASTEAKTPAQRRREVAEVEAAKKTAKDDDMSDMGMTGDPPTSEAQRKAMWAAKSGHSTLGIPQSVGAEFAKVDKGGKLPSHAKDREIEYAPDKLYGIQNPDGGTGGPDNAVRVHDKVTNYEPKKGRWGGRAGHSMAKDASGGGGPGLETAKAENNESGTGSGEMPTGRRGGRASPHLKSGQALDGGPGSGPSKGEHAGRSDTREDIIRQRMLNGASRADAEYAESKKKSAEDAMGDNTKVPIFDMGGNKIGEVSKTATSVGAEKIAGFPVQFGLSNGIRGWVPIPKRKNPW